MKKIFLIGWKDVTLAFRDRAGLILMLLAPFVLTLGLGFVTGRFSSSSGGPSGIPVVLVNQDGGQLGNALVELFNSKDLADLVSPTPVSDPAEARRMVDANQANAAVIIPAGFSQSIIPTQNAAASTGQTALANAVVQIGLYTNPTTPTGAGIIKTIVDQFVSQVEIGRVNGLVSVTGLIQGGLVSVQDAAKVGAEIGARQSAAAASLDATAITLKNITTSGKAVQFDALAYMAPGMALMFLMYTVSNGGRTLLTERTQGTLPRLLVSPTSSAQVLGGKVFGIYLTGVTQMLILMGGCTLLFHLSWGDPLGVVVLILAAVAGAIGWGMLITSLARTPGQVTAIGSAIMLTFGMLGGSFISTSAMPGWFQVISKITPNAWGLDGFTVLGMGGGLGDILTPILALLAMGAILFGAAVVIINRRGLIEK